MSDMDPRWQWAEERRFCDPNPTYVRVACNHLEVVPVETTAGGVVETVAHLCLTCDTQLPAEWRLIDFDDPIDEYRQANL